MVSGVWHERHEAGVFDGLSNLALVLGTEAVALTREDFKLARHKFAEKFNFFVIDRIRFFLANITDHIFFEN
ncbi:MAG: hypothetical protein A3C71_00800 [Candidatus Yanofskybacteria bacterium RIFCSPHIGHO2_02_FULL_43_15c]|uniref:Uncharacterized protein n=2 Tax=Candidatus Yanofskyibacteriota TaxID=1752733 RepID=A0A1F8GYV4_9BACT|nr:MAG: hypothetical protein A3C71_00800 [Candidatus Yanofskybacteria bacterium RIFCSPHIGHO2_02_FULL_43_15c]OGN30605.1 MAG: hypothetical protein A3I92_00625 [Candidatus Yanofskybacteria bacterium RIFCSPLOWO2_02_FULL_43_10b]